MSSKQRKKASLAALKSARSGRRSSSSALDDVGLLEDDAANADVYEVMDEAEYRDYVQRKREREDFVVDDDGLGYHDDGDYDILGMAAKDDDERHNRTSSAANSAKSSAGGGNALTKEAVKKARKIKAAAAAATTTTTTNDRAATPTPGGGGRTKTMWDFLNKSGSLATMNAAAAAASSGSSTDKKKKKQRNNDHHHDDLHDINDNDVDVATAAAVGRGGKDDDYRRPTEFGSATNSGAIGGRRQQRDIGGGASNDIDDLLDSLDNNTTTTTTTAGTKRSGRERGCGNERISGRVTTVGRSSSNNNNNNNNNRGNAASRKRTLTTPLSSSRRHPGSSSLSSKRAYGHRGEQNYDDDDDNEAEHGVDFNSHHRDVDFGDDRHDKDDYVHDSPGDTTTMIIDEGGKDGTTAINEKNDQVDTTTTKVVRPGRLAGRLAAATQAKEAEAERNRVARELDDAKKRKAVANKTTTDAAAAVGTSSFDGGLMMLDMNSASFQPAAIPTAGGHDDNATGGGSVGGVCGDLERIIMTEVVEEEEGMNVDNEDASMEVDAEKKAGDEAPRKYIDMYWFDASERNGIVSLYGKVKVPIVNDDTNNKERSKKNTTSPSATQKFIYQSCCITIPNNERNLFVLPRLIEKAKMEEGEEDREQGGGDGSERYPILEVYAELKSVLQPACIPHAQGNAWKAKPVTRSYAFEDASIPRTPCQYMKVVYDGKFPVPDRDVCVRGGVTFEKILGGGATNLENFLIKRRLMGPGWVRVYNPRPVQANVVSWCKWECVIDGPKSLKRLDLITPDTVPQPPPVSTVSIKFKTVVHPKSHKLEIVCVSAICHSNVMLEGATPTSEGGKHMTALTLVRPHNNEAAGGAMAQFPRDMEKECTASMPELGKCPNERALLSRLFAQIGTWDPDILVSHNGWGHDIDLLLSRCVELKVSMWSKIGRRRQMRMPSSSQFGNGKDWAIAGALDGRLLCDTYISAKEFLSRETTYSLVNLAKTQLKVEHEEIESVDVPQWCRTGEHFVFLAKNTQREAQLVQALMFKLQVLPLTKQLTNIAGNLWGHTMKGNRAERNEYLLLHEFHQLKYLVPEKRNAKQRNEELFGDEDGGGGGTTGKNNKAKYSGGLVLEPKKGLYDSFILLLDFNSLYPSLIQEYNLCFTTVDWAKSASSSNKNTEEGRTADALPSIPGESLDRGVLPRVIKTLVDRRRNVKKFMTNEKDKEKKEELNIRQMALKLTANSMYGCLGFSNSRFYAQPIAALVTAMGRDTLQRTVDLAQTTIGLEVIYGDTDSIMINTRITDVNEYSKVLELGNTVKREVNKLYKTLELEVDGVFRSMLLLKKKKYAAVTITTGPDGQYVMGKETKGLDLVRRDWCIQSKESGLYILDQILSGDEKEIVVNKIHDHLEKVAAQMRGGELPLDKYVITKGLNKHPNDYPDAKSQAHVYVAKRMINDHKAVGVGDHIPYVITASIEEVGQQQQQQQTSSKKDTVSERARHPDEISRSNGVLKPDVEWYLLNQILPPISRLCEPIEGTSPGIIAEKLGLDSSKYNNISSAYDVDDDDIVDFTPASCLPDEERFKGVEKLVITCSDCNEEAEFPGIYQMKDGIRVSGLRCPNPRCGNPQFWGEDDRWSCVAGIRNKMSMMKKKHQRQYYDGWVRCDDPMCGLETRQLSVFEGCCLKQGCNGRMKSMYTESTLQTQLKYFDSLFDITHVIKQQRRSVKTVAAQDSITTEKLIKEITLDVGDEDMKAFQVLHSFTSQALSKSGYNFVGVEFFQNLFGATSKCVSP